MNAHELLSRYASGDRDFRRVELSAANLSGADLTDANLTAANLTWARLTRADLTGVDLRGADLTGADLTGARLTEADLTGAIGIATAEEEAATWLHVCRAIVAHPEKLNMSVWHGDDAWLGRTPAQEIETECGTTHCLAGWAQAISDDPVVRQLGPSVAGSWLLPRHAYLFCATEEKAMIEVRKTLESK